MSISCLSHVVLNTSLSSPFSSDSEELMRNRENESRDFRDPASLVSPWYSDSTSMSCKSSSALSSFSTDYRSTSDSDSELSGPSLPISSLDDSLVSVEPSAQESSGDERSGKFSEPRLSDSLETDIVSSKSSETSHQKSVFTVHRNRSSTSTCGIVCK